MKRLALCLALLCAVPCFAASPVTFQVTIGASTTQISATHMLCNSWIIQNNAAHNVRFGDSSASSTKGTLLVPGASYTSQGSQNGTQPEPDDLSQWYVAGTQNDVVDVTCKQIQ